jgi:hypothetical protein
MSWLFRPLLLRVAGSTDSALAKQVEFLKAENQILRKRIPKRVVLTDDDDGQPARHDDGAALYHADGEKCPGGMTVTRTFEDKTGAAMMGNLMGMMQNGMCSCCMMMNGMCACCCNMV